MFSSKDIDAAIEKERQLVTNRTNRNTNLGYVQKSMGLDPGFGSNDFGVCITELLDGVISVLHAEEYPRPKFNQIIETTVRLLEEYDITFDGRSRIFVDGANPSFIRAVLRTAAKKGEGSLGKEATPRDHMGWDMNSKMPSVYVHYFGTESCIVFVVQVSK